MTTSTKARGTFDALQDLITIDIQLNHVPALLGEAGIGKSSFIKALASKLNTQAFVLSVNTLAGREDLTGARLIKDDVSGKYMQVFFPHQSISEAIEYASAHPKETPILFLDEFNRTTPDVTSAIFQLITERRIGSEKLPTNLRLIVAGNDVGNVEAIDSASTSRLSPYSIEPDLKTFLSVTPNLNSFVEHTLQKHPQYLLQASDNSSIMLDNDTDNEENDDIFGAELAENFRQIATPRTWEYLSDVLNAYELYDVDIDNMSTTEIQNMTSLMTTQINNYDEDSTLMKTLIESKIGQNEASEVLYNEIANVYDKILNQNIVIPNGQAQNNTLDWRKLINTEIYNELIKLTKNPIKTNAVSDNDAQQLLTDTMIGMLLSDKVSATQRLAAVMTEIDFEYHDGSHTKMQVAQNLLYPSNEGTHALISALVDGSLDLNSRAVKAITKYNVPHSLGEKILQLQAAINQ